MKVHETTIFVFIASVIIGLLISLNISFKDIPIRVELSTQQYQQALNSRSELLKDIDNIKEQYYENYQKLSKYQNENPTTSKINEDITAELKENSIILGTQETVGKGLEITVNDASQEFDNYISDPDNRQAELVHNTDILIILNEIRSAGAEGISINDQRIISTTEVYCSGPFLSVNHVKLAAPYYINVIGNPDVIRNYIEIQGGYLNYLKLGRGIQVKVEVSNEVKIPAYGGDIKYKYSVKANE